MPEDYHRGRIVRLRSDLSGRVQRLAEKRGETFPATVTAAVTEYLDRHDEETDEGEQR